MARSEPHPSCSRRSRCAGAADSGSLRRQSGKPRTSHSQSSGCQGLRQFSRGRLSSAELFRAPSWCSTSRADASKTERCSPPHPDWAKPIVAAALRSERSARRVAPFRGNRAAREGCARRQESSLDRRRHRLDLEPVVAASQFKKIATGCVSFARRFGRFDSSTIPLKSDAGVAGRTRQASEIGACLSAKWVIAVVNSSRPFLNRVVLPQVLPFRPVARTRAPRVRELQPRKFSLLLSTDR